MEHGSHKFTQKVFYSDTDAYGVVWHGSYLRWLEMGRVLLCEQKGYKLSELVKADVTLPVTDLNIKYKHSARLDDIITIKTNVIETGKYYIIFHQTIEDEKGEKTYIDATVKVVAIHNDGKLYRSLPEQVIKIAQ